MTGKVRKPYKKILAGVCLLLLLLNLVAINQAYHLTHFYEHGTVKPLAEPDKWEEAVGEFLKK